MRQYWTIGIASMLSVLLCACTAAAPVQPSDQWMTFSSTSQGFQSLMIGQPKEVDKNIPIEHSSDSVKIYVLTSARATGPTYGVTVSVLPGTVDLSVPQPVFENSLQGLLNSYPGSHVTAKTFHDYHGKPAMDFTLALASGTQSKGMMVLSRNKIYQVSITGVIQNSEEEQSFLESFRIL